jgi:hypothetical protein
LAFELFAAGFHLDEDALGPDEVGVVFALGSALLGDSGLSGGTGFLDAVMAEGAEGRLEMGKSLNSERDAPATFLAQVADFVAFAGLCGGVAGR